MTRWIARAIAGSAGSLPLILVVALLAIPSSAAAQPLASAANSDSRHIDEEEKCKPFETDPASVVDFGGIPVGERGLMGVTVTNPSGNPSVTFHSATTSGDPFSVSSDINHCIGKSLAPNSNCVVIPAFAPTQVGKAVGTFTVDYSGCPDATSGKFTRIKLRGVGVACKPLDISPDSGNFGKVEIGTTSQSQGFIIENPTGNPTITVTKVFTFERIGPFRIGLIIVTDSHLRLVLVVLRRFLSAQQGWAAITTFWKRTICARELLARRVNRHTSQAKG